jgi:hypothetical protein
LVAPELHSVGGWSRQMAAIFGVAMRVEAPIELGEGEQPTGVERHAACSDRQRTPSLMTVSRNAMFSTVGLSASCLTPLRLWDVSARSAQSVHRAPQRAERFVP